MTPPATSDRDHPPAGHPAARQPGRARGRGRCCRRSSTCPATSTSPPAASRCPGTRRRRTSSATSRAGAAPRTPPPGRQREVVALARRRGPHGADPAVGRAGRRRARLAGRRLGGLPAPPGARPSIDEVAAGKRTLALVAAGRAPDGAGLVRRGGARADAAGGRGGRPEHVTLLEEPQAAFYAWIDGLGDGWRRRVAVGDLDPGLRRRRRHHRLQPDRRRASATATWRSSASPSASTSCSAATTWTSRSRGCCSSGSRPPATRSTRWQLHGALAPVPARQGVAPRATRRSASVRSRCSAAARG